MANYDIPQYPIKRLRYFNNQFLKDQDFIDDTSYQIGCERALLRSLCVAGVCEGLVVSYPATNAPPSVSAGIAIDNSGQMIVLGQPTNGNASPAALADGDYFVHISFVESEDDKAAGQGAPDYTRWTQTPLITATAKTAVLPDGAVVLGSCTVKTGLFVGSGTTIGRQYSGLRLPGPNQSTTAALRNTGASDDLAVLGGSLTIRRDASGQLGPALTLLNGAGSAGAGGAIDFNGSDPGTNDPTLRLQSLDDGNYSSHLTFATKKSGAVINGLVERLRLTSDGVLQFPNDVPKDKIILWGGAAASRYGLGMNDSNINVFCPPGAHFSLRQDSSSGTEVFTVSDSGAVAFSGPLTIRKDVAGQLGPKLTLLNGAPSAGSGGAIDFNGYDPGVNDPSLRLQSLDDGNYSSHLTFATKQSGADNHKLVERLRLTSDGTLQFPDDVLPKDKIIIWGAADASRYGIGINELNINLFYPTGARFSLRQGSSSGTEVFSVSSSGAVACSGPLTIAVGTNTPQVVLGDSSAYFAGKVGIGTTAPEASLHVTNGSRFSGDRHWFTDSEGSNRLRVGTAWSIPAVYSEDVADIFVGCRSGQMVHLGQPNTVTVKDGDITISGNLGSHGYGPNQLPSWMSGGVTTYDLAAHGTGYAIGGFKTQSLDLAERFAYHEVGLEPGDVLAVDPHSPERLIRSRSAQQDDLVGVVSERPGFVLGVAWEDPEAGIPLALAGRVPVKVNLEGGPIRIGDYLTSSSQPGVAMRTVRSGRVLGLAMQAFDGTSGDEGKVVVLVNPHWFGGR